MNAKNWLMICSLGTKLGELAKIKVRTRPPNF